MSETTAGTTGLTSQYATQVAGDLERNLKEQERIGSEIAALQEQLAVLQQDHSVLENVRQALGVSAAPAEPVSEPAAAVPAPRTKTAAKAGTAKASTTKAAAAKTPRTKKSTAAGSKSSAKKSETEAAAAVTPTSRPTLVDIVREYLNAQAEPRSAAEITNALGQAHPERTIKATVVRTTLEGLVAKNQAHRSKQGTSVFYTAPEAPKPTAEADQDKEQSA
ncbi:hypothetical protein ACFV0T_26895 [Streptomyces sp. NPDC059582]|uniref:hypothetical protein n=1 Tax=Streptomyces sp. NPDC059582 TaxID=3346875 RepID=UPI0036928B07